MEEQNSINKINQQSTETTLSENKLGSIVHILGLLTSFMGPLVMYFLYKEKTTEKLRINISNTINWQLTIFLIPIISFGYIFYEVEKLYNLATVETFSMSSVFIAIGINVFVQVINLILSVIGAIKSYKGDVYKYPMTINFVK